jgi:hypothetical protein
MAGIWVRSLGQGCSLGRDPKVAPRSLDNGFQNHSVHVYNLILDLWLVARKVSVREIIWHLLVQASQGLGAKVSQVVKLTQCWFEIFDTQETTQNATNRKKPMPNKNTCMAPHGANSSCADFYWRFQQNREVVFAALLSESPRKSSPCCNNPVV